MNPDTYPILRRHSRHNRIRATEAEAALWAQLRNGQLGCKFRRQYIIGDYITDFICLAKHLIIEVDGGYHLSDEQQQEDAIRSQFLSRMGFRIIRFTNQEVMFDTDSVLHKIKQELTTINQ